MQKHETVKRKPDPKSLSQISKRLETRHLGEVKCYSDSVKCEQCEECESGSNVTKLAGITHLDNDYAWCTYPSTSPYSVHVCHALELQCGCDQKEKLIIIK